MPPKKSTQKISRRKVTTINRGRCTMDKMSHRRRKWGIIVMGIGIMFVFALSGLGGTNIAGQIIQVVGVTIGILTLFCGINI